MLRRFLIGDLRALAARALQSGDYAPAASARIRAIPDTRTIRYYTTLGLITPPAEMRGRRAYYDETHVLQVVAIKRLQAEGVSLAAIQQKLLNLPSDKLQELAKLPPGFWEAADEYLSASPPTGAASEHRAVNESVRAVSAIRLTLSDDLAVVIEGPPRPPRGGRIDTHSLLAAAQPLLQELRRQKLIDD